MKITQEQFEKIKKTAFLRPKFSSIELEYVHTKLVNKKKRRGNYRFVVTLPYLSEGQVENIQTHFVLQPQRRPYFITHTLETDGKDLRMFLEEIEENQVGNINGNAVKITTEDVLNPEKLAEMKRGLVEALIEVEPTHWELSNQRICITIDHIGIYKFKPLINL